MIGVKIVVHPMRHITIPIFALKYKLIAQHASGKAPHVAANRTNPGETPYILWIVDADRAAVLPGTTCLRLPGPWEDPYVLQGTPV
jgi:hypothetical protein